MTFIHIEIDYVSWQGWSKRKQGEEEKYVFTATLQSTKPTVLTIQYIQMSVNLPNNLTGYIKNNPVEYMQFLIYQQSIIRKPNTITINL